MMMHMMIDWTLHPWEVGASVVAVSLAVWAVIATRQDEARRRRRGLANALIAEMPARITSIPSSYPEWTALRIQISAETMGTELLDFAWTVAEVEHYLHSYSLEHGGGGPRLPPPGVYGKDPVALVRAAALKWAARPRSFSRRYKAQIAAYSPFGDDRRRTEVKYEHLESMYPLAYDHEQRTLDEK